MKDEDFSELVKSIKQAGAIRRGEAKASRASKVEVPDVQRIRRELRLSQTDFAHMIGVSPRTVQNWEQGRRAPEGAARALLLLAARHPKMVLETLHA